MIGEKDQGALVLIVPDLDAAQEQIALGAGHLVEEDELVASHRAALQDTVVGALLHAGDEEDALGVKFAEPVVIVVAAVEDHDGSRLETQGAGDAAFVDAALGDEGIARQQSLMIEQQVQLHRALGAPVLGPVKDRGAQRDEAGVEREQFVFEAEAMASGHLAAAVQQLIEDALVQLPVAMLVGVGQGGARRGRRQTQMAQLAFAGRQPAANLGKDCARPKWQNSMATNWPQQVKPRACRSARR